MKKIDNSPYGVWNQPRNQPLPVETLNSGEFAELVGHFPHIVFGPLLTLRPVLHTATATQLNIPIQRIQNRRTWGLTRTEGISVLGSWCKGIRLSRCPLYILIICIDGGADHTESRSNSTQVKEDKQEMTQSTEQDHKESGVLDWSNDPDNAKNWSTTKKLYNTAVPALLCFLI